MTFYIMEAKENYDSAHVSDIAALTTYADTLLCTDQNYQGVQWDAVRRNLMYMFTEATPESLLTNTTGHTLWNGADAIVPDGAVDPTNQFNSSIGVKNIDTEAVTFYPNYDVDNLVPNGIGGGDGTWRRYTQDFLAGGAFATVPTSNGPGMTDPYTGNFWINSQSCPLYCFRLEDDYSQVISPLSPVHLASNDVMIVGFTNSGATSPWSFAREIDKSADPTPAYLYLVPRLLTAAEIAADYLLAYATYSYPVTASFFPSYNREVFDHAGNMYLLSCSASGGKAFKLYKFAPPSAASYPSAAVGGGFTDITPWGGATGPNADASGYTLARPRVEPSKDGQLETSAVIPLYLPLTNDLVLIEKFFPIEHTALSYDPALMSWSCTYVHSPASGPSWDHHSAFVTGYMTEAWAPTDISGAAYAVTDAYEVNNYLGQSDYSYDIDYTKRWFFFVCTKMTDGVSDGKPRIVLVEYQFVYGSAPSVVQVIDEQGWDDVYPGYAPKINDVYAPYTPADTAAVAVSMNARFNPDTFQPLWDCGVHDPVTNTFWWSGGATDLTASTALFGTFDPQFADRMRASDFTPGGSLLAATPPFMALRFSEDAGEVDDDLRLRVWGYALDGHDYYVLRVGPSATFVYDLTANTWAEWQSPGRDNWRAVAGQNWIGMGADTFALGFGTDVVAGDDVTGTLWILDPTYGRDDRDDTGSDPFDRIVTGGITLDGREVADCNAVTLQISLGSPSQIGAEITLLTSDDMGHIWLDHGSQTIVAADYSAVIEWRSLGLMHAPGRIFSFQDNGAAVRITAAAMR